MGNPKRILDNLVCGATWLRALLMVLFALIYGIAEIVVAAVALLQFVLVLFTGEGNRRLQGLGAGLAAYVRSIIRYWTFDTDEKPFPFADWPGHGA